MIRALGEHCSDSCSAASSSNVPYALTVSCREGAAQTCTPVRLLPGKSGDRPASFRVSADLSRHAPEQTDHAALIRGCPSVPEDSKMGMLDEVIAAALGSKGQPSQGQPAQA